MEKHTCTFCKDHSGNNDATKIITFIYAAFEALVTFTRKACGRCINAMNPFIAKGKMVIIDIIEIEEEKGVKKE